MLLFAVLLYLVLQIIKMEDQQPQQQPPLPNQTVPPPVTATQSKENVTEQGESNQEFNALLNDLKGEIINELRAELDDMKTELIKSIEL